MIFFMYVLYSTLLHLPPLRFHYGHIHTNKDDLHQSIICIWVWIIWVFIGIFHQTFFTLLEFD
jgi:hypothetical protein